MIKTWKDYPIIKKINGSYNITAIINNNELPYNVCSSDESGLVAFPDVEEYYNQLEPENKLVEIPIVISETDKLETYRSQKLSELRERLDLSDYQQSKMIDGAMSAEEYEPTKIKRASWRTAFNAVQIATTTEEIDAILAEAAE